MAAVRSPIGSDFQSFCLASETKRWNWGSPLKIVLNGRRDSKADAVAQTKTSGRIILNALIQSETEIEIAARSSLTDSISQRIYARFQKFLRPFAADRLHEMAQ